MQSQQYFGVQKLQRGKENIKELLMKTPKAYAWIRSVMWMRNIQIGLRV